MAAVIFFGAVSCAKEDISSSLAGGEVEVTFTANLPELGTRAYGNAEHINILHYNVYQHGQEDQLKISGVCTENNGGKFIINIPMIKGMKYDIVFWAQNKDCGYYNLVGKELTINYNGAVANDENRDAFLATLTDFDPSSAAHPYIVELKRPFAQLNVATSDYNTVKNNGIYLTKVDDVNENIDNITSDLKITTQVDTKFNLFTNEVADGSVKQTVTFAPSKMPCALGETLNNYAGYTYLSMNYIFVLSEKESVDVEYNFTGNRATDNFKFPFTKVVIPSVPLKRNYRTNILGKLLTQAADFEVVLEKEFEGTKEVAIWDGVATEEPVINGNIYEVYNAAQLAHIANLVNGTLTREAVAANDLAGKTVKLMNDIYLANEEWTPIGNIQPHHFKGTFDGNGKTIYGLKVTEHNGAHPKGLIGIVSGNPTVKNLTIDGATVAMKNDHTGDFYAAGLIGTFYGNLTVEGVTVKNSTFVGNNKVAGLLAHDGVCSSLKINNCHILNCNISSANLTDGGNVGGLLGLFQGAANGEFKITNSSVKNSTIVGINSSNNGKRANGEFVACVSSKENQTLVIENCEVEGNDFTQTIDGSAPVTYVGPYDNLFVGGERNGYEELPGSVVIDALPYPHTKVATWAEFDAAITNNKSYLILTADISTDASYTITKNVTVDLNGKTLAINNATSCIYTGVDNKNTTGPNVTFKNGNINCIVYGLSGNLTLTDIVFGGTIGYVKAYQGVISTKYANLLAERCDMASVKASAPESRPRALCTEAKSSGYIKLIDCNFPSASDGTGLLVKQKLLRTYINPLSGSAVLEITNCKFGVAANIDLGASYVWSNMNLTGCKGGFTFTISRKSTSYTDEEKAFMQTVKANNTGDVRLDWTDVQKMYVY